MTFLHLPHFQIPVASLLTLIQEKRPKNVSSVAIITSLHKKNSRVLSAKCASVFGVLGNFHLLDDLSQGGTITSSVFTANSDLLRVLSLTHRKTQST